MATTTATPQVKNEYGYPDGPTTEPDFLHVSKGIKSWMLTLDHKRIGMMYLFGILGSLIVGGAFALLVRTELWAPGKTIVDQDTYNAFFTLHLSLIHISEPTRLLSISYAVFCLK